MRDLKKRILLFTVAAITFLIVHLISYVYNINVFKKELDLLESAHEFMEDVLELRRYEKNFIYYIDSKDINEILDYIKRIRKKVETFKNLHISERKNLLNDIKIFKKDLRDYQKLIILAKNKSKVDLDRIRKIGHKMTIFAENVLKLNKKYVNSTLDKLLIIPSIVTFLFGISLIILLLILAHTITRQISFIQETTEKIAKGDFSYIPEDNKIFSTFSIIIKAFNTMIKELEEREEALIQSKKLAAIGTLVSGIAHELNNPLNNIYLTADSLLEDFQHIDPKEVKDMLRDIINEARRASYVVKDLLDFSKRKKIGLKEVIDIKDLVDSSLKLVKNQMMISGIQVKNEIPKGLPKISGKSDELKQVFVNLFLNAIDAMPDGGLLKLSVDENKQGFIGVKVEDTGIGMAPEIMERIFDPFFSTKPVGKGTGLGLSIVYGIIKKHGGHIEVKSKVNEGTTFVVYLPVVSKEISY